MFFNRAKCNEKYVAFNFVQKAFTFFHYCAAVKDRQKRYGDYRWLGWNYL